MVNISKSSAATVDLAKGMSTGWITLLLKLLRNKLHGAPLGWILFCTTLQRSGWFVDCLLAHGDIADSSNTRPMVPIHLPLAFSRHARDAEDGTSLALELATTSNN